MEINRANTVCRPLSATSASSTSTLWISEPLAWFFYTRGNSVQLTSNIPASSRNPWRILPTDLPDFQFLPRPNTICLCSSTFPPRQLVGPPIPRCVFQCGEWRTFKNDFPVHVVLLWPLYRKVVTYYNILSFYNFFCYELNLIVSCNQGLIHKGLLDEMLPTYLPT